MLLPRFPPYCPQHRASCVPNADGEICCGSGPLFFGFSDVHVQRAIATMYTQEEMGEFLNKNNATIVSSTRVSVAAASYPLLD